VVRSRASRGNVQGLFGAGTPLFEHREDLNVMWVSVFQRDWGCFPGLHTLFVISWKFIEYIHMTNQIRRNPLTRVGTVVHPTNRVSSSSGYLNWLQIPWFFPVHCPGLFAAWFFISAVCKHRVAMLKNYWLSYTDDDWSSEWRLDDFLGTPEKFDGHRHISIDIYSDCGGYP
jgi:hypothetical protein